MVQLNREDKIEFKRAFHAALGPLVFIFILVGIRAIESSLDTSFYQMGILPLNARGLIGIITSPLVHGDWDHLLNNSLPILVLGTMFFYFHHKNSLEIILMMYFMTGIWLWLFGRPVYHIGASGIVYSLAAYHITYGFVLRNPPMLALTFLVLLLYGSMVWFLLPVDISISWEAHLCGAMSGTLLAIYYGKEYKKSQLKVRGAMHFTHPEQYGEKITYVYHYKAKETDI